LPSKHGGTRDQKGDANNKKEKKYKHAASSTRVGKKQWKQKGPEAAARLPVVTPATKCKLRLLKLDRMKDYLMMEEEFVAG
jgi:26S proteasome regulatory subunit T2